VPPLFFLFLAGKMKKREGKNSREEIGIGKEAPTIPSVKFKSKHNNAFARKLQACLFTWDFDPDIPNSMT
jgi:hypothetical protein